MNYSFLHKLNTTCINHSIMFLAEPYKHKLTDIHSPERSPHSPGCLSHKSVVFARRPCQNYSVNYRAHCVHCTAIRINRTTGQVKFLHLKYIKHSNMLFFPQSLRHQGLFICRTKTEKVCGWTWYHSVQTQKDAHVAGRHTHAQITHGLTVQGPLWPALLHLTVWWPGRSYSELPRRFHSQRSSEFLGQLSDWTAQMGRPLLKHLQRSLHGSKWMRF